MSNNQSYTPFYEVASRSIDTPARDAVKAEAERREKQRQQELSSAETLTPEQDAELEAWQESEMKKHAWMLDVSSGDK